MVPDKFNMVDMGGIDLILMQGETVPDLYQRLVESIAQCRYQCLYNWLFDGIQIPPTYVIMEVDEDTGDVLINEGVRVTEEDVIHIDSLVVPVVLESLNVTENGTYVPRTGVDGFDEVVVDVPADQPVLDSLSVTENGTYVPPSGVDGYDEVVVNVSGSGSSDFIQPQYMGLSYVAHDASSSTASDRKKLVHSTRQSIVGLFNLTPGYYLAFVDYKSASTFNFLSGTLFPGHQYSEISQYIDVPADAATTLFEGTNVFHQATASNRKQVQFFTVTENSLLSVVIYAGLSAETESGRSRADVLLRSWIPYP